MLPLWWCKKKIKIASPRFRNPQIRAAIISTSDVDRIWQAAFFMVKARWLFWIGWGSIKKRLYGSHFLLKIISSNEPLSISLLSLPSNFTFPITFSYKPFVHWFSFTCCLHQSSVISAFTFLSDFKTSLLSDWHKLLSMNLLDIVNIYFTGAYNLLQCSVSIFWLWRSSILGVPWSLFQY